MARTDLDSRLALLHMNPLPSVYAAMCYLEKHGKTFLVDFGTHNAVALAQSLKSTRRRLGALKMHRRHRNLAKQRRGGTGKAR